MIEKLDVGRRRFLTGFATAGAAGLALPILQRRSFAQNTLAPTPACDDGDEPTPAQTEGPYFTPNSPERGMLREADTAGTPIVLAGAVFTRSCQPVAGALVELWHANDAGEYDNEGFWLRGHQFTDADGRYSFETIVPGLYPGRTRHFHLKFQAANNPVLTTQFYFPGERDNERDGIFNPELLLSIEGDVASYATVLDLT